jgi:hypothetical protein
MKRTVGEIWKDEFSSKPLWKVKFPKAKDGLFYVFGYPTKREAKVGSQLALSLLETTT